MGNSSNRDDMTSEERLIEAIRNHDYDQVRSICRNRDPDIVFQGPSIMFALEEECDEDMIEFLLELGASPNDTNSGFPTPLAYELSHEDRREVVSLLLEYGADVHVSESGSIDDSSILSILTACRHHSQNIDLLLEYNASLDKYNSENQSPLICALCSTPHPKGNDTVWDTKRDDEIQGWSHLKPHERRKKQCLLNLIMVLCAAGKVKEDEEMLQLLTCDESHLGQMFSTLLPMTSGKTFFQTVELRRTIHRKLWKLGWKNGQTFEQWLLDEMVNLLCQGCSFPVDGGHTLLHRRIVEWM